MGKPGPKPRDGKGQRDSVWLGETARAARDRLLAAKRAKNPGASRNDVYRDCLIASDAETFVVYQADVAARLARQDKLIAELQRENEGLRAVVTEQTAARDQAQKTALDRAKRVWKANPDVQQDLAQLVELEATGSMNLASQAAALNRAREILGSWKAVQDHVEAP